MSDLNFTVADKTYTQLSFHLVSFRLFSINTFHSFFFWNWSGPENSTTFSFFQLLNPLRSRHNSDRNKNVKFICGQTGWKRASLNLTLVVLPLHTPHLLFWVYHVGEGRECGLGQASSKREWETSDICGQSFVLSHQTG